MKDQSKRRSAGEWSELVELYAKRSCSRSEFLEQHGISGTTLNYQISKRRESSPKFHQASVASAEPQEILLELPGEIRLTIKNPA